MWSQRVLTECQMGGRLTFYICNHLYRLGCKTASPPLILKAHQTESHDRNSVPSAQSLLNHNTHDSLLPNFSESSPEYQFLLTLSVSVSNPPPPVPE